MQNASGIIVECFKELLQEKSFGKITVHELCEKAGVSRKTFYVYFDSKYSIVKKIVMDELISPMLQFNALMPSVLKSKAMVENTPYLLNVNLYNTIYANRDFYSRLCCQAGSLDSPLVDALIEGIAFLNRQVLDLIGFRGPEWKQDAICYYFAAGNAVNIQRWIKSGFQANPEDMGHLFCEMTTPFWKEVAGISF